MKGSSFIVSTLINMGTTDIFGIPGAVVLDFLYEAEQSEQINIHLNYHEQMSSYAAIGYAQASGNLGAAYSTRGPGVTNMMTAIAEAYFESIPVLFLTAHSCKEISKRRCVMSQEMDYSESIKAYSKFSARIETAEELTEYFYLACKTAVTGRKGPVFIDINASLFSKEIDAIPCMENSFILNNKEILGTIQKKIETAKRPILLIGDGIRQTDSKREVQFFAEKNQIPVLSSRGAQDLLSQSEVYFGYIGSHGVRYSNFILSKADLIISLGNRLAFPTESESYRQIYKTAQFLRVEVDENELENKIPNSITYLADLNEFKKYLLDPDCYSKETWIGICQEIRKELLEEDITDNVQKIINIIKNINFESSFVADVGNNEFWVSRAYERVRPNVPIYFSKSYCELPKFLRLK